ncbi:MAG: glycosyltransferase family 4 protein [Deltaproteobacteria bacterium]|nr:glycosyltransferase family 4 protein [Deltaproteobacteria bacterium]
MSRHDLTFFNSYRPPNAGQPLIGRLGREARSFAAFVRMLLRHRPAVVHVKTAESVNFFQGVVYVLLARITGCRVLLQVHGGAFDSWYEGLSSRTQAVVRAALRLPHRLIVLSEFWRRQFEQLCPERPVSVIPNGVEVDNASPRTARQRPGLHVITIGAIGIRKGHFDIVEAARMLSDLDIVFDFVGPDEYGGETAQVRQRVSDLGLDKYFELTGPLTGHDKWDALAKADVFLLPAHNENMPNSVLEAMAASLPVVATDVGAVREMLGDAAILVPIGDPAAIAAQLRTLHDDPKIRFELGLANRERVVNSYSFAYVELLLGKLYTCADIHPDLPPSAR